MTIQMLCFPPEYVEVLKEAIELPNSGCYNLEVTKTENKWVTITMDINDYWNLFYIGMSVCNIIMSDGIDEAIKQSAEKITEFIIKEKTPSNN